MVCPACGVDNPEGKRFCGDCGSALALTCAVCGATSTPDKKFCGDCGAPLNDNVPASPVLSASPAAAQPAAQVAERRLTSVLFADLVGFTTLAEGRDAEDVRELLSDYFVEAEKVITRYGGVVEKFIGDAVMAVWGVPVAHEDDAQRAVRAGFDLIAAIGALGDRKIAEGLSMRVGIVTGEVAVTLGAVGQGMVAGDAVNTAARIQAAAAPGQVWVDDRTRSLSAAAVSYVDEGEHELRGKAGTLHLYSARAIVATLGSAQRVDGLEAPFIGRDHELRLVKELFHASMDESRPHMATVFGLAGVGKSRLAWEFEKYVDGITQRVKWHRARALSYGDGVAFWSLAEMVRSRLRVTDEEVPDIVSAKLDAGLDEYLVDRDEQRWLRPRLATLLGVQANEGGFAREDLFAAWTTYFERVSGGDQGVVMVFDDMQYADPSLLDFLDHLLETARFPLFVLVLARPELGDIRPGWGSGRRATAIHLEPLNQKLMGQILDGLVAALPEESRAALVERAEGIPLYALETVRALIDRDAVVPKDGRYVLASDAESRVDLATLGAPASLHALIAARLDALSPAQRQLVQRATLHGLTFPRDGLAAVANVPNLDDVLAELVRKEIFTLHVDRFSPERGQYKFVQALVRTVAYDTLSKRDRKTGHLAVAAYLESTTSGDEIAAIIARHYVDAIENGPNDDDVPELQRTAIDLFERAGHRAEALGAPDEALRHYRAALEREPDADQRGELLEGAARAAKSAGRFDDAIDYAEQTRKEYTAGGRVADAARLAALMGDTFVLQGRSQAAVDLMAPEYDHVVTTDDPLVDDAVLALAETLARAYCMLNDPTAAQRYADRALMIAEARQEWDRVVSLLGRHAVIWALSERPTGAIALLKAAVELGHKHHTMHAMITPLLNTSAFLKNRDVRAALEAGREGVELAMKTGTRDMLPPMVVNTMLVAWIAGEWDEVESLAEYPMTEPSDVLFNRFIVDLVRVARGRPLEPATDFDFSGSDDTYGRIGEELVSLRAADRDGDDVSARKALSRVVDLAYEAFGIDDDFTIYLPLAVERATAAGDIDEATRMLAHVTDAAPGLVTPLAHAHVMRLQALLSMARGEDDGVDALLESAAEEFETMGVPFYRAKTLLDLGQRAIAGGDIDAGRALLDAAAALFGDLGAAPWVNATRAALVPT